MRNTIKITVSAIALASAGLFAAPAIAADEAAAPEAAAPETAGLTDIVVTATKTASRLSMVPRAMSSTNRFRSGTLCHRLPAQSPVRWWKPSPENMPGRSGFP